MALRIRNAETQRLIQELSKLTGESPIEAISNAVRERLFRVQRERQESLVERLLAIGVDCAAHLKEPYKSVDHDRLLYGKNGLPR